jgi:hypothetical protein
VSDGADPTSVSYDYNWDGTRIGLGLGQGLAA